MFAAHVAVLALCLVGVLAQPAHYPAGECHGIAGACSDFGGPRFDALLRFVFGWLPAAACSLLACLTVVGVIAVVEARDGPPERID
ncbi:hypothetical protein GCM10009687_03210 [Asanoa iriomotensis]|uniref:Uncharacterized protein n=1 Tax=Asanoa iriomotensis TaxID=234613 RepID=A0ABQ4C326_9ACTN|nr:hypothetical protein Air01nite_32790 [Asanoa iriomotensis]